MDTTTENIALLIDADNSPSKRIDFVLAELAKYDVVNIRRAYGNWKSPTLTGWEARAIALKSVSKHQFFEI